MSPEAAAADAATDAGTDAPDTGAASAHSTSVGWLTAVAVATTGTAPCDTGSSAGRSPPGDSSNGMPIAPYTMRLRMDVGTACQVLRSPSTPQFSTLFRACTHIKRGVGWSDDTGRSLSGLASHAHPLPSQPVQHFLAPTFSAPIYTQPSRRLIAQEKHRTGGQPHLYR
eukprot:366278-Chlamydomonas_euryale.AAC.52